MTIIYSQHADIISPDAEAFRGSRRETDGFFFQKRTALNPGYLTDIALLTPHSYPKRDFIYTAADGSTLRKVPSEYSTIQAAIDAAVDYDTVLVADGTYSGPGFINILGRGKKLTLLSENGPETCIMDGVDTAASWVYLLDEETTDFTICGFTAANFTGPAVRLENSSVTLVNCILTHCQNGVQGYTTGVHAPTELRCSNVVAVYNHASNVGGGFSLENCAPTLTNCTVMYNTSASVVIGAAGISCYYMVHATMVNCIVWGNRGSEPGAVLKEQQIGLHEGSTADVTYSDVQADINDTPWPGVGNINANPRLDSEWKTEDGSPCRNTGSPLNNSPLVTAKDLYGNYRTGCSNPVDMGATEHDGEVLPAFALFDIEVRLESTAASAPVTAGLREDAVTLFTPDIIEPFGERLPDVPQTCVRAYFKPQVPIGSEDKMFLELGRDVPEFSAGLTLSSRVSKIESVLLSGSAHRLRIVNTDSTYEAIMNISVRWKDIPKNTRYVFR